jgi:hypothetical protein
MFKVKSLFTRANKPSLSRQNGARNLTAKANGASLAANIAATPATNTPAPVKYAKMQLKSNNVRNWTGFLTGAQPIHRVVMKNQPGVLKELLKNPAINPNNRTEGGAGYTPLMLAAMRGFSEIVDILLADPRVDPAMGTKAMFGKGKTAADMASDYPEIKAKIEAAIAAKGGAAGGRRRKTRRGRKASRRTRRR